jgi:hypothetical protein
MNWTVGGLGIEVCRAVILAGEGCLGTVVLTIGPSFLKNECTEFSPVRTLWYTTVG